MDKSTKISLERASQLKSRIEDYVNIRKEIPKGLELKTEINSRKEHILKVLGGTEENWNDYKWQLSNRITNVDTLSKILKLTEREIEQIREV